MAIAATLMPGDLLYTRTSSCVGRAIRACTLGGFDHVALVAPHPDTCELLVYEAFHRPMWDAVTNCRQAGVHASKVDVWLRYQRGSRADVYHARLSYQFAPALAKALAETAASFCLAKTPYDFFGAWLARAMGGRWATRWLIPPREHTGRLYCVEYVGIVDRRAGILPDLKNASAWSPAGYAMMCVERGIRRAPELMAE